MMDLRLKFIKKIIIFIFGGPKDIFVRMDVKIFSAGEENDLRSH